MGPVTLCVMHDAPPPRYHEQQPPRRLNPLLLVPVLVALALSSAFAGYTWNLGKLVNESLPRMDGSFPPDRGRPVAGAPDERGRTPLNVLFLGSDRVPRNAADPGYSADTVLLVHVDAARTRADVISVPGDAMVTIPGVGRDRISASTTRGGVPLAVASVEGLLGARVDHVVVMDLDGVAQMTDAVGGVDVEVTRPFRSGGREFAAGRHHLDGAAALAFVREQQGLPGRQKDRISNQTAYLHALVDQLVSHGTLTDPGRLQTFLQAVTDNASVDDGLTGARLRDLAVEHRHLRVSDAHFRTVPVSAWRTDPTRPTVVELDPAGVAQLRVCLRADDLAGCG